MNSCRWEMERHEDCFACRVAQGKEKVELIYDTDWWRVEIDSEVGIPGFLVIVTDRHVHSLDELPLRERESFNYLLVACRRAMRDVAGIQKVTLVQEETSKGHFHLWLFPWHEDFLKNCKGKLVDIPPLMERYTGTYDEECARVTEELRKWFSNRDNVLPKESSY